MVSDEALKKVQEQIAAWPMERRFVVQQLIEDYRRNREDLRAYKATGLEPEEVLPKDKADEIALKLMRLADLESLCSYTRLRELAEANEIANLKADADALRNKLADTEAALGRANAAVADLKAGNAQQTKEIFEWQRSAQALHDDLLDARERTNYAEAHPWRNLWAWVKRKLG